MGSEKDNSIIRRMEVNLTASSASSAMPVSPEYYLSQRSFEMRLPRCRQFDLRDRRDARTPFPRRKTSISDVRPLYPKRLLRGARSTKSLSYKPTPGIYNAAEKFPLTSTYLYVIVRANV